MFDFSVCWVFAQLVCSVRTDLLVNGAQSRLHISGATYSDSGNYTCMMGRTAKTLIELQIIPGNISCLNSEIVTNPVISAPI